MSEFIKRAVLLLVVVGAAVAVYFKYEAVRPCGHVVRYSIASVDPRFGTATSTVVAEARAAANIWNAAGGKTLLAYDPAGEVKINLVYDERESAAKLGQSIAREQASLDATRASLDSAKAQYDAREAAYNQEVAQINARGGASPSQFSILTDEKQSLLALGSSIESQVASYNLAVRSFNQQVASYNATVGHTFEEGQYVSDASGERINIFEYVNDSQLERVLAHELGHAIGLDHNGDPASIMYAENESGNLKPTQADLDALKALCG